MDDDAALLQYFAESRDEESFAQIVSRHLPLVFSTALRSVGGDVHLAEEVAQTVFFDVARKAKRLSAQRTFAAWLYTATRFAAAKAVRAEQRRRNREREAQVMEELSNASTHDLEWASIRPVLDDVMLRLKPREREAVLLRHFEGQGFAEIGASLGLSESGARMRVERALEKLRSELGRRGVRSTATALGLALSSHAVAAPPVGLAASVTSAALTASAASGGAVAIIGLLSMTKAQVGIIAGIALAGVGVVGVQRQEQAKLRKAIVLAEQQAAEVDSLKATIEIRERAIADFENARDSTAAAIQAVLREIEEGKSDLRLGSDLRWSRDENGTSKSVLRVYNLAELEHRPAPVKQVAPNYLQAFQDSGIPGRVKLEFVLDPNGDILEIRPFEATHPEFALEAMEAALQWKFAPGIFDGEPVNTRVRQVITFSAGGQATWF